MAPPSLPLSWQVNEAPNGGADVAVFASRRGYLVYGAAMLAALSCWKMVAHWAGSPPWSAVPWVGATVFFGLFGLWCAFGEEVDGVSPAVITTRISKSCSAPARGSAPLTTGCTWWSTENRTF
jgi:hypothetical protein